MFMPMQFTAVVAKSVGQCVCTKVHRHQKFFNTTVTKCTRNYILLLNSLPLASIYQSGV